MSPQASTHESSVEREGCAAAQASARTAGHIPSSFHPGRNASGRARLALGVAVAVLGTVLLAFAWKSERSGTPSSMESASAEPQHPKDRPPGTPQSGAATEAEEDARLAALYEKLKAHGLHDSLLLFPVLPPHSDQMLGQLASEGFGLASGRITWPENVAVDVGANPLVRFWEMDADSPHGVAAIDERHGLPFSTYLRSTPSLRHAVEWDPVGLPEGVYAVSFGGHDLPVPIFVEAGVQHFDLEIPEGLRFELRLVDARTGEPVVVEHMIIAPVRPELPHPVGEFVEGPASEFDVEVDSRQVWLWVIRSTTHFPLMKEPFEVPTAEPRVLTVELEPMR